MLLLASATLVAGGLDGVASISAWVVGPGLSEVHSSIRMGDAAARSRDRGERRHSERDDRDSDRSNDNASSRAAQPAASQPSPAAPSPASPSPASPPAAASSDDGGRGAAAAMPVAQPDPVQPTPANDPAAAGGAPAQAGRGNGVGTGNLGSNHHGGHHGPRPPRTMVEAWDRLQNWMKAPPPPGASHRAGAASVPRWAPASSGNDRPASGDRQAPPNRHEGNGEGVARRGTAATGNGNLGDRGAQGGVRAARDEGATARRSAAPGTADGAARRSAPAAVSAAKNVVVGRSDTVTVAAKRSTWHGRPPPVVQPADGTFVPKEIVVLGLAEANAAKLRGLGFGVRRVRDDSDSAIVTTPAEADAVQALETVRQAVPTVSGFNRVYRPFGVQGGLAANPPRMIQAAPTGGCPAGRCFGAQAVAWRNDVTECARAVRIGVLDTGVDRSHPAFAGHALKAGDFHRNGAPASNWHGTGVLALLAGDAASGTPGLVPHSDFYVADVFYADAKGQPTTDTGSLLRALEWMDELDVKIVNMSLAGPRDDVMDEYIKRLAERGVIVVAAAGNEGPSAPPLYPAAYPDVIAVTAIDRDSRNYRYANRGDYIDVAAPGVDVWTAVPGGRAGLQSGTSFAAPYVTAAVAAAYADAPKKTKAALLAALPTRDLGPPGRDPVYGLGLVQAPSSCHGAPPTSWPAIALPASPEPMPADAPGRVTPASVGAMPADLPAPTRASLPDPTSLSFSPAGTR